MPTLKQEEPLNFLFTKVKEVKELCNTKQTNNNPNSFHFLIELGRRRGRRIAWSEGFCYENILPEPTVITLFARIL